VEKTEVERKAERVSDAAVERYWGGIEKSRSARAVHKKHVEGLTTGEKVLRYFDVSSQYGVRSLSF
jgi:DNA polymerase delta subunit 4